MRKSDGIEESTKKRGETEREREEIWSSSKEKSMNSFVELALIKSNYASFVVVSFFSSKRIESPRRERERTRKGKRNLLRFDHFLKLVRKFVRDPSLSSHRMEYEAELGGVDDRREGRFSFRQAAVASWMWVSLVVRFKRIRF